MPFLHRFGIKKNFKTEREKAIMKPKKRCLRKLEKTIKYIHILFSHTIKNNVFINQVIFLI